MKMEVKSICEKWMLNINEHEVEENIKNIYKQTSGRESGQNWKKFHKIVEEIKKREL